MPVRAQKLVKQFRGVIRSDIKKSLSGINSILVKNGKAEFPFLTDDQNTHLIAAKVDLAAMLNQKVAV